MKIPDWKRWGTPDPVAEAAGISFDRAPAGEIRAPTGRYRVCAYHVDFDEAPTVYVDVDTLTEARKICDDFSNLRGKWNVDYAMAFDARGSRVAGRPLW